MNSKDQVKPLIRELVETANKPELQNNHAVQLYRAMLEPIIHLESIIWRFRHVVEKSGVLHMQALSVIRKMYYQEYMYGPHVKAILDYLVEPSTEQLQFSNLSEAQDYLNETIKPTLYNSLSLVNKILSNADDSWSLEFDAYLVSGYDAENNKIFISDSKRFEKSVNIQYVHFIKANLHRAIGGIEYLVNYNIDAIPSIATAVVKKTAINSLKQKLLLKSLPEPTTPYEMVKILKGYSNFLTLRKSKDAAQDNLNSSMNHFYEARVQDLIGYQKSIDETDHDNTDQYFLNPIILKLNRESKENRMTEILNLYKAAINGNSSVVTSEVTGQQVEINISAIFKTYDDLKVFLPNTRDGFNSDIGKGQQLRDANNKKIKHSVTGQSLFAWNYTYGKPMKWPDPTFAGFLPKANNENLLEIARTMELTDSLSVFKSIIPIP